MALKKTGLLNKVKRYFSCSVGTKHANKVDDCHIVSHHDHCVSRKHISNNALTVLNNLRKANYDAFLVGGGVRDLLLDRQPKDFDVVTSATPEQVRKLFRNSRIIGRRFRLVHVYFRSEIIEVSTFRADNSGTQETALSMIKHDNTYGTIVEDAWRRDFTVNALFYDSHDLSIIDFMSGLQDIQAKQIRIIGDPVRRFHEDPVRLLRAIRLAAKLNFEIHETTKKAVVELSHLLQQVPEARLLDEIIKLFFEGNAQVTFAFLKKMHYLPILFPSLNALLQKDANGKVAKLIELALVATDKRFYYQKPLTPGYLLAVFLWPVLQEALAAASPAETRLSLILPKAMNQVLRQQSQISLITRRMSIMIESIWTLQSHLEKKRERRIYQVLGSRYFRAAFDLLELRAQVGDVSQSLVDWWRSFSEAEPKQRDAMLEALRADQQ